MNSTQRFSEVYPYLAPGLAGADAHEWFPTIPLDDTQSENIRAAGDIYLRKLRVGPFHIGLVDLHASLMHARDRFERCSAYFFSGLKLIDWAVIAEGSAAHVNVERTVLARHVVALRATGVILVHSHPSGIAKPSENDINWVKSVADYLACVDARVYDSLIITDVGVCSMLGLRTPAEVWPEIADFDTEAAKVDLANHLPATSQLDDGELRICNLAKAAVASRRPVLPPVLSLEPIARLWMLARISPAIGIIGFDVCRRALACEIIGNHRFDNEVFVRALQFAIRWQAVEIVLVVHDLGAAPKPASEIAHWASILSSHAKGFDVELRRVLRTGSVAGEITAAEWEDYYDAPDKLVAAANVGSEISP